MIENTKCECGHQNHVGTVLCESCGKPLQEEDGALELLEMRYDGVARRSQRQNPSWIDRIWNFFSSVKIAVYLIIITLLAASLGTIYPQEPTFIQIDASRYYEDTYGWTGKLYYLLGLSNTYESWWFITLLVMIGTSLVVCSIDRVLPLYRALSKQKIAKHPLFLGRQRVVYRADLDALGAPDSDVEWTEKMAAQLRKKRYNVHVEGSALLAEKNRFSRWGPYINHIGLIIFLLAVLLRNIPAWHMDEHYEFLEGEIVQVPNTNYYLKNEKFTVEFYDEQELAQHQRERGDVVAKLYETQAVLYECTAQCGNTLQEPTLTEVHRHDIRVNSPLNYNGFMVYQVDYNFTPTLKAVTVSVQDKLTGTSYDAFRLDMKNPQETYRSGPYSLELLNYFPDFAQDEKGKPITRSNSPNKPAFIFSINGPELPADGAIYIYFPKQVDKQSFRQDDLNGALADRLELGARSMDDVEMAMYTSFLNVRIDKSMPYIWVGAFISMLGLVMGMYWQHRRIWLRIDDRALLLGGHTNKNWLSIRRDVAAALAGMNVHVDQKALENKGGSPVES